MLSRWNRLVARRARGDAGSSPGEIVIERGNFRSYFPLATSINLSVVVSLRLWPFNRQGF
ncbi:MAG: DUF2905 domain-containing protein [Alphaproteobacteria bacterium]|nr:DUF2905 domain-containing protein [Alphaproteobacteria bacterium]MBM3653310.1 DUF2905 domain-containing protein [Alphaproteobacteria bacterium]